MVMSKTAPLSAVRWSTSLTPWIPFAAFTVTNMFSGTAGKPLDCGRVNRQPNGHKDDPKIGNKTPAMTSRWTRT